MHLTHLAQKSAMITTVNLRVAGALQLRQYVGKQSAPIGSFGEGEVIPRRARWPRKHIGKRFLGMGEDVHGEALRLLEVREDVSLLAQREQDKWRIQRQGGKRIYGYG